MPRNPPRRARPRHPDTLAPMETRSPRYRLLAAAARLTEQRPEVPSVSFEMDCPACGKAELFTQRMLPSGPEYVVADHECIWWHSVGA